MHREPRGGFLDQTNHRDLPADYAGDVLIWDIDKTYLDTHFSSVRGLLAIPFEWALDKESIPGAVPILRALRRGPTARSALVPLYFISGSPPQLRGVIERRMTMDGVEFDGITFKDQLGLVLRGRPRDLKEQVGYKLTALLLYRQRVPEGARWLMFGDDVEADAEVFLLFGEVLAGCRGEALGLRLRELRVHPHSVAIIRELADPLPITPDPVEHIFIHLERRSNPARFTNPRIVATRSYLQTALVLTQLGRVRPEVIGTVQRTLRLRGASDNELREWVEDAMTRLSVSADLGAQALEGIR